MTNEEIFQRLFYDMIQHIKEKVSLKAVVLFGSRARGKERINSDYDLVIIAEFKEKYLTRSDWILDFAPFLSLDLFCYTPQEFESLFSSYNITAIDAIGEGLTLFGSDYLTPYKKRYNELLKRGLKKYKCILIPPSY